MSNTFALGDIDRMVRVAFEIAQEPNYFIAIHERQYGALIRWRNLPIAPWFDRARDAEAVLTELLRLYKLRFEIADRERAGVDCRRELLVYGTEKKAAWKAAEAVLAKAKLVDDQLTRSTP